MTKELVSTVTSKGQVTIPVEVRRRLGVRPPDKIAFIIEDHQVRLARRESVVTRTAGVFRGARPVLGAEEMRELAEQAIARDAAERAHD